MTPDTSISPEALLSLSELARWAFLPVESVRRRMRAGDFEPDFLSTHGIYFKKSRVAELVSILQKHKHHEKKH